MKNKTNKSSMLYWYPKTKVLDIPQPKTEIYTIPKEVLAKLREENMKNLDMREVRQVARKIGYPLFLRTDLGSGKHFWKRSCYVEKEKGLDSHIFEVISFNLCADVFGGLPFKALVFREFIPMDSLFTAFFGEMPVNPEIRFFIKDGKILCWHWYWIEDAIRDASVDNWRDILSDTKLRLKDEILQLKKEALKIAEVFDTGYWSLDFCRAKDGRWIFIDMAEGVKSWHQEGCIYKQTKVKEGN